MESKTRLWSLEKKQHQSNNHTNVEIANVVRATKERHGAMRSFDREI